MIYLSTICVYYTWRNIKKADKNYKYKISALPFNAEFEVFISCNSMSDINDL